MNTTFEGCNCICHNSPRASIINHFTACCEQCPYCMANIAIHYIDEHKEKCAPIHSLDVELGFFNQNREEWCKHHTGKFALIKGVTVNDFYDTQNRAYEVGCDLWGLVSFLIKEVRLVDKIEYIPTIFEVKARSEDQDEKPFSK